MYGRVTVGSDRSRAARAGGEASLVMPSIPSPSPYYPSSSLPFIRPPFHSFRQVPPIVSRHACASGGQFCEAPHRLWCTRLLPASVTVTDTRVLTLASRDQETTRAIAGYRQLGLQPSPCIVPRVSIIKQYQQSSVFVLSLSLAGWPLNIKYIKSLICELNSADKNPKTCYWILYIVSYCWFRSTNR